MITEADIGFGQYPLLVDVSDHFSFGFENSGYCLNHHVYTLNTEPKWKGRCKTLGQCLVKSDVPDFCYSLSFEKFRYLKGAKHIKRKAKNGHEYTYSEGAIAFPDFLDRPGRTRLTSEGTLNRSSHYILDPNTNKYRILTAVECERMNEFPDDWTKNSRPYKRRYFRMGNALVTGLISSMGDEISLIIDKENQKNGH